MVNIYPGHAHSLNDIDAAQAALSDAGVISVFDMCYDVRSSPDDVFSSCLILL